MEAISFEDKVKEFLSDSYGYGYGSGYGYGYGDGSGSGDGSGDGYGSGYGYGYDILQLNGENVYSVDGVPTILRVINEKVAKGAILSDDMTLTPCFVVKGNGYFAHGKSLRDAMSALSDKVMENMPEEDRIAEFVKAHPEYQKAYPNRDLYEWHHRLTGSCEMGRKNFIESKGLSLDGETSVEDFINLTENSFGSNVIRKLKTAYQKPNK